VEFGEIVRRSQGTVAPVVAFIRPAGVEAGWERTNTWKSAETMLGVTAFVDVGGEEAARFGAATSGTVVLFDESGTLVYSGGITASRGHQGDNAGRRRVLAFLRAECPDANRSDVFGCPLVEPAEQAPTDEKGTT
jgi:hypothetical protein